MATAVIAPALPAARRKRSTRRIRPDELGAGQRIGPWRIERELGRGGMATVYAVAHTGFGKRAALKLAHRSALGSDFTADTFLREARVVHLVDHPGVCDVFATGTFDNRPYLAMERLAGRTLGEVHAAGIERAEALRILCAICEVLAAAHARGVVHRDLKLDNIFVENDGSVRVVDWGIARVLGEPDPLRGMVAGTLTYVAPEQVTSGDITPASDIYSIGVVAYQLLVGTAPFNAKSDLELIWKHVHAQPPRPRELRPDLPAELDALIHAMLAKDPAKRPTLERVMATLAPPPASAPRTLAQLLAPPCDALGRAAPLADPRAVAFIASAGAIALVATVLASYFLR